MDFFGLDRSKAIANCDSIALGRAGRDTDIVRGWNRLRPENILDLLGGASEDARRDAHALAALMVRGPWRLHMQVPVQGKATQLVGNVREVGLTVTGREYRLQLTEGSRLQLERIVQAA
ncbi:hypothetical protein [Xanthomonas maliensis]|uniref:hypothetical protein n=1 Tax=Xanthomonas maliensis TaxID=1321368 RepID=UPI0003A38FC0|nr:hypothetical protein [Xanthomonas maliensis]KAB7769630.1 hypothetical protein CKY51_05645 [Xanthomonas maliensis]